MNSSFCSFALCITLIIFFFPVHGRWHNHAKNHKHSHHHPHFTISQPPSPSPSPPLSPSPEPTNPPDDDDGGSSFNATGFFDVRHYGAIGDGTTDDTEAFKMAWDTAFNNMSLRGNGVIDGRGQKWWDLPCKPHRGGKGRTKAGPCDSPIAIRFFMSSNLTVEGLRIKDSPQFHFSDSMPCVNLTLANIELFPSKGDIFLDPFCWNAYGDLQTLTIPPLGCLLEASSRSILETQRDYC
ncbi:Polygalacturonase, partial [Cucurbita argyrosperma subsp. argyrosperma]